MFDMTQDELIALNPDLINGNRLRIPSRIPAALADRKEYKSLSKKNHIWIP
jgi:hypothetical protein